MPRVHAYNGPTQQTEAICAISYSLEPCILLNPWPFLHLLADHASSYVKCEICTRVKLIYFALVHIHRYLHIDYTSLSRA